MAPAKALVGMSGGVDSSVAAYLILKEGIPCLGATMRLHENSCSGADDIADARAVAGKLGIDHCVLDFRKEFSDCVVRSFAESYEAGLTPNPCIRCNRHLKFGHMLTAAREMGCDCVVSGHYARIRRDPETGRYLLYRAADPAKDQSYFLASLTQEQLCHIRFPLGELTKEQVRAIAREQNFGNARKKDSQDICFIPDGDYSAFLERYTGKKHPEGNYLDRSGKVIGTHRGAVCYTIGQRKGLGIALGVPAYVCAKDMQANTLTLGSNEDLFSPGLLAKDWVWYPFPELTAPMEVTARIRHSQASHKAVVYPESDGYARVKFETPQRAISPGQAVVLYQEDLVIGGGTIVKAL